MLRTWGVRRGGRVQPWPVWVAGGSSTPTSMCELSGSAGWMAGFELRSGLMAKPVTETSHGWVLRRRLIRSRLSARRNESPAREWFRLGAPLFHRRVARGERRGFGPPGVGLRARVNGRRAPGTACRSRRRPSCSARRSSQRGGFSPPVECAVAIVPSPVVLACHGGLAVALCSPLGWGCQIWTLCEVTPRGAFSLTTP